MSALIEAERAKQVNEIVSQWTRSVKPLLTQEIATLGVVDSGELLKSLRYRTRKNSGAVERVTLSFAAQGLFALLGAGPGKRVKRNWYGGVVDDKLTELADRLAEADADLFIKTFPLGE